MLAQNIVVSLHSLNHKKTRWIASGSICCRDPSACSSQRPAIHYLSGHKEAIGKEYALQIGTYLKHNSSFCGQVYIPVYTLLSSSSARLARTLQGEENMHTFSSKLQSLVVIISGFLTSFPWQRLLRASFIVIQGRQVPLHDISAVMNCRKSYLTSLAKE